MAATNGGNELAAYTATVPTGTRATLTIANNAKNGPYILVTGARLRGHQYAVAQHSSIAAGSGLMTLDQNVLAGDEVLTLMMHSSSNGVPMTVSGLDVPLLSSHDDHPTRLQAVGRATITADQTPRAMSFTGEANGNAAMKAITFIIRGA
jgi:hypothetical protein